MMSTATFAKKAAALGCALMCVSALAQAQADDQYGQQGQGGGIPLINPPMPNILPEIAQKVRSRLAGLTVPKVSGPFVPQWAYHAARRVATQCYDESFMQKPRLPSDLAIREFVGLTYKPVPLSKLPSLCASIADYGFSMTCEQGKFWSPTSKDTTEKPYGLFPVQADFGQVPDVPVAGTFECFIDKYKVFPQTLTMRFTASWYAFPTQRSLPTGMGRGNSNVFIGTLLLEPDGVPDSSGQAYSQLHDAILSDY